MSGSILKIPIGNIDDDDVFLHIYPEKDGTCFRIDDAEADLYGESKFQLYEGFSYEYYITSIKLLLEEINGITKCSNVLKTSGRITPGINTGRLTLRVLNEDNRNDVFASVNLEIRSIKVAYRSDYRIMMEDITNKCADLLMRHSSPVTQSYIPFFDDDPKTSYQRFAFIKSMITSDEFQNAVHKIIYSPVVRWDEEEHLSDIRNIRRINRSQLRQIASSKTRMKIPTSHSLSTRLPSIPDRVIVKNKRESIDTQENRFIKHAITSFYSFIGDVRMKLLNGTREYDEAVYCENLLDDYLGQTMFKEISTPSFLGLNSPILQRKEGYREVYRVWLMFELAAKLTWSGGDDVYNAGKRDVATLYEYWVFFKLFDLFQTVFEIDPMPVEELIEATSDGLNLKLKSGKHTLLKGMFYKSGRRLNIQFSYNRTFWGGTPYPNGGSWTLSMRPDFTLSIWPEGFNMEKAEQQENIIHIHFDAKYKIDKIQDVLGKEFEKPRSNDDDSPMNIDTQLDHELLEQKNGTYKRADLLKMHAYKDAVRRTAGAYILYPGDVSKTREGFHELIPGLGAFTLRPSENDTGISELAKFINDVLDNQLSRTSQQEKLSYQTYEIHKGKEESYLRESTPEILYGMRTKPPTEVFVLIGFFQEKQKEWISWNGLYNIRFNDTVTPEMVGARYILLYGGSDTKARELYEVTGENPELWSRQKLISRGYPKPSEEEYFVFKVKRVTAPEFENKVWDVSKLTKNKYTRKGLPFTVSLSDLMFALIKHTDN